MGLPVAELTETEEVALQVCNSIKSDQILDIKSKINLFLGTS